MKKESSQLTSEMEESLKQGTKVEFKWHGSDRLYTGRIEVDEFGALYFINEHCFDGNELKEHEEGMRYYNRLDSFFFFTYFKILLGGEEI